MSSDLNLKNKTRNGWRFEMGGNYMAVPEPANFIGYPSYLKRPCSEATGSCFTSFHTAAGTRLQ